MNHIKPGFNDGVTETVWLEDSSQYYCRCISLAKCRAQGIGKNDSVPLTNPFVGKKDGERRKPFILKEAIGNHYRQALT